MSQHPAAIAALLLVLTPWTANAQTGAQNFSQNSLSQGSQAHSITVYGGDLNLATGAARATLAARIGSAVESVCGFPHSAREA
ncbi:MAG TPA: UrcA family protein, partial [Rhizomicrobium sp.]|nr:UrcA family protein [Rhizomicrobium sp.]